MKLTCRPAERADVPAMVPLLRPINLQELSITGRDATSSLMDSLEKSDVAWTYLNGDEPLAMGGIGRLGSLIGGRGCPWLVGTTYLDQWPRAMLRYTRQHFHLMKARYRIMENYTHADDEVTIKWLLWLGFKVGPLVIIGNPPVPIRQFTYGV